MTLTTCVAITSDELDPAALWAYCQHILGATTATFDVDTDMTPGWAFTMNTPGQGFAALLAMRHRIDADAEPYDLGGGGPDYTVCVSFDTPYSYRGKGKRGETSGDLHRRLTAELGAWLDDQGISWWAQDEYTGRWLERTPCPLEASTA